MMYRHILLSSFLLLGISSTIAQEEVFFNDTNVDKKEIKVSKTVQGVSLHTNFIPMMEDFDRTFEIHARYFHEDRIAPTLTLHSFVGLQNDIVRDRTIYGEFVGVGTDSSPMHTYYDLNLQAGTELRWYFGYRSLYKRNRKLTNNSGWFLAVPLTLTIPVVGQPRYTSQSWVSDSFSVDLEPALKIGYRYAFNKHWMIEGTASYTPFYIGFDKDGCWFDMYNSLQEMFRLELKTAYTF